MPDDAHFSIQDLADLADVSRRTVRYYVQEGLLPAPFGVGRGNHYGRPHLERILQIKTLQAAGRTLVDIRGARAEGDKAPKVPPPERSLWRRLQLAPGVELHVAATHHLPSPSRLHELAEWCRLHVTSSASDE